jgi:hypothetical protein
MAAEDFVTLAARLSSFDAVIKFSRKTVKWSRDAPSPADLAAAGFFWKPSASSHDNTQCFLCERALDNWEKDDAPLAEHLKHSPECGWAAMMEVSQDGAGPATMEDPTDARLLGARKATFADIWPHEGKRGWLCKTAALSAAGWYFAPTPESDDFVSCAYCKLSLDGWEPKDSPLQVTTPLLIHYLKLTTSTAMSIIEDLQIVPFLLSQARLHPKLQEERKLEPPKCLDFQLNQQ